MLNLTELGVEVFIKKAKNIVPYWDNYDLVIWKKDINGFTNIKGIFKQDMWGTAERFVVDQNGVWKLPKKYVKNFT
ncbi:MAG: hypothetical protein RLZZ196_349 [Bacteroidota bacterium]|jgi:hypothetical protein